jgi:thymidylate kinase
MIIAIDGLDGSGKETLTYALRDYLVEEAGWDDAKVMVHSFPNYNSRSGMQIRNMLAGKTFTDESSDLKAYLIASMFAFNRAEYISSMQATFGEEIFSSTSVIHIFDRYWGSNVLYQGLGKSGEDLQKFIQLMRSIDTSLKNPMPDRYYFLRHPYSVLRKRLDARKSKSVENDNYEKDTYLKSVYHLSEYLLEYLKPPINPIYNTIIEGSVPCIMTETVTKYIEREPRLLVKIILDDLDKAGILKV